MRKRTSISISVFLIESDEKQGNRHTDCSIIIQHKYQDRRFRCDLIQSGCLSFILTTRKNRPIRTVFLSFGCGDRTWTCGLRVMSPTSYQLLYPASSYWIIYQNICIQNPTYTDFPNGAGDRGRTGTIGKDRRILSPVRLPIPPLRRTYTNLLKKWLREWGSNPQPTG